MGLFGGSSASSQTLTNAISYTPVLNLGDDNKNKLASKYDMKASSEATAKDELSASVGVGVGGGSGSGGAVSPTHSVLPKSGVFDTAVQSVKDNTLYYIVGGVVVAGGALFFAYKR